MFTIYLVVYPCCFCNLLCRESAWWSRPSPGPTLKPSPIPPGWHTWGAKNILYTPVRHLCIWNVSSYEPVGFSCWQMPHLSNAISVSFPPSQWHFPTRFLLYVLVKHRGPDHNEDLPYTYPSLIMVWSPALLRACQNRICWRKRALPRSHNSAKW